MASEDLLAAMHKVFTPGFPITQKDLFRGASSNSLTSYRRFLVRDAIPLFSGNVVLAKRRLRRSLLNDSRQGGVSFKRLR